MEINLLSYDLDVKNGDKGLMVYDRLRRKYVPLTPEENIRQRFVAYLISEKGYLPGLMNNEIAINQNGIKRRCDTVVFDRNGNPIMIVEYKAPQVRITQDVFNQIYRYNTVLKVKYLVVANGINTFCCINDYEGMKCLFVDEIPMYAAL